MNKVILVFIVFFSLNMSSCATKKGNLLLNNSHWVLSDWPNKSTAIPAKATLIFSEDGRVNGKSFCNNYGAEVKINGNKIHFDKMFSTKMFCQDLAESEDEYLADLSKVDNAKMEGNQLFLYQNDVLLLVFKNTK